MRLSFKTILIPVDFSINTKVAINKALSLAGKEEEMEFHLLHVKSSLDFDFEAFNQKSRRNSSEMNGYESEEIKMKQWKDSVENTFPNIKVCTWISVDASVQKIIEEKAKQLNIDLIIIGKNSNHSWFSFWNTVKPSEIARSTGCSVLTVKPGALNSKIRTIVVPVSGEATQQKMETIALLSRKFHFKIHLVTFLNEEKSSSDVYPSALLQSFRWLKENLRCPVEYSVLHGYNKAKTVLDYAQKIDADVLLVNPLAETRIGWPKRYISDLLPPNSKVQLLLVQSNLSH